MTGEVAGMVVLVQHVSSVLRDKGLPARARVLYATVALEPRDGWSPVESDGGWTLNGLALFSTETKGSLGHWLGHLVQAGLVRREQVDVLGGKQIRYYFDFEEGPGE